MIAVPRKARSAIAETVLPIAVTMGDPAGIGLDIALMAWVARTSARLPAFALYGEREALERRARRLGLSVPVAAIAAGAEALGAFPTALPLCSVGQDLGAGTSAVVAAIAAASAAVANGEALALLTNPATKQALQGPELAYPGHTQFLASLATRHYGGRFQPVMMLVADELKVVPTTVHIPLAQVPGALSRELLLATLRTTAAALVDDFGIAAPRLAVAGLNPHAGEGGLIGREEALLIRPALAELAAEGLRVSGPHPADTLFHREARTGYDAAVAMYHDQALIPLKTLAFDRGVNVTLGLPFVRTSPDHGTAFPLAGTGKANPASFIAALRLADELGRRRRKRALPAS